MSGAKKMVMKRCYRSQVVKSKKGKGSFKRQEKHKKAHYKNGPSSFDVK